MGKEIGNCGSRRVAVMPFDSGEEMAMSTALDNIFQSAENRLWLAWVKRPRQVKGPGFCSG